MDTVSSELVIGKKNNNKKLYTVLSYWGDFTFRTCKILICLVCIVASFKLSVCNCCWLAVCIVVVILCVFVVLCVYCCFYFRCRTAG